MQFRDIYIVKIGAIGDVIMASSMLTKINELYPSARIHWICSKTIAPLLGEFPDIYEIIEIEEKKLLKGSILERSWSILGLWLKLFGRNCDMLIVGHPDPRYRILTYPLRASVYRYFNSNRKNRLFPVPGRRHSDEYARLVTEIDDFKSIPTSIPKINIKSPAFINQIFLELNNHVIAIAPGGAKNVLRDDNLRRWPILNYVELTKKFLKDDNFSVIITGSPDDQWVNEYFNGLNVTNLIGKTSINDLVSLFEKCDLIITHDSGPLHLAQLARTKTIALFGPTNPYEKITNTKDTLILWRPHNLACCPCYDGREYAKCSNNVCLKSILPSEVYHSAMAMI